jgi:uncharacterized protein
MFLKRSILFLVGLIITALGIQCTIQADLGVGAWDTLVIGLTRVTGLSYGMIAPMVGTILVLLYCAINKARIPISSLISAYLLGFLIDFYTWAGIGFMSDPTFVGRVTVLILGITILAVGVGFIIESRIGIAPHDLLVITIEKRTTMGFALSKMLIELSMLSVGLVLGGPVGVGTLIITFLIGPIIAYFQKHTRRFTVRYTQ